ncbi:hypothetical protein D3C80_1605130 [compost metagenome]
MHALAVPPVQGAAVVGEHDDGLRQLDIRLAELRRRFDEGAGLGEVGGESAGAVAEVTECGFHQVPDAQDRQADQGAGLDPIRVHVVDVVDQVLADARQLMDDLDPVLLQLGGWADAREQ